MSIREKEFRDFDEHLDWQDPESHKKIGEVFSPYNPFLEDGPPEWFDDITEEMWAQIEDMKSRTGVGELLTPDDRALIEKIAENRWMLHRNVFGWRCGRCNRVHEYITTGCMERPMNGADEVLLMLEEIDGNRSYSVDHVYSLIRTGVIEYISKREAEFLLNKITDKFGEGFLTKPRVQILRR